MVMRLAQGTAFVCGSCGNIIIRPPQVSATPEHCAYCKDGKMRPAQGTAFICSECGGTVVRPPQISFFITFCGYCGKGGEMKV